MWSVLGARGLLVPPPAAGDIAGQLQGGGAAVCVLVPDRLGNGHHCCCPKVGGDRGQGCDPHFRKQRQVEVDVKFSKVWQGVWLNERVGGNQPWPQIPGEEEGAFLYLETPCDSGLDICRQNEKKKLKEKL